MEKTIGMRIKECRRKLGMTQEELAEILFTKKNTISMYENGKIDIKVSILQDIAKALNTTAGYLLDGEEKAVSPEVMQVAMMLQEMKSAELREAAMEQVKILVRMDGITLITRG